MDRLLYSKKQSEIDILFKKAFDFNSNIVLFPVRHHSPACSWHLKKVIENYKPDAILIEAPENAQSLMPFMASENTKTPFCIYLSFDDKDGNINNQKEKYKVYYPFLDFSPELVAIRKSIKDNIKCFFIDLSYADKMANSEEYKEDDDNLFTISKYHEILTQKLGCKNFSETWEMLFEIGGWNIETEKFVKNVFQYCYYSRLYTDEKELLYSGDLSREYFMKQNIKNALSNFNKVLVVTGGIHTIALSEFILNSDCEKMNLLKTNVNYSSCYLMPYSFEESDQNYGYSSGMAFPFFYQKVWENMNNKINKPFDSAVLGFIINTARTIRKKQPISITDEIQSYYMATGLADLREKKECGVFEVIDSVKSSFVKGEINFSALKTLYKLISGMKMGKVDPQSGVPPIVNDFIEKCKYFKMQINTSLEKEIKLDINNNPTHREKSSFLYQMSFLNTSFCNCIKSQENNYSLSGRILLRETWKYCFSPVVQTELIAVSVYGATVKQAALKIIENEIKENHNNTRMLSEILIDASHMGLDEVYSVLIDKLYVIVNEDMDFFSVSDGFCNICMVKNIREILEVSNLYNMEKILTQCLSRIMTLMYTISNVKKEDEEKVCSSIKFIYSYFIDNASYEKELFIQNMDYFYNDNSTDGALLGLSAAVLLKNDMIKLSDVMEKFNSYINSSDENKKIAASFLKGFFKIAKDIIFVDNSLLLSLDKILCNTDGDLFLEILPDLRLAFTDFMVYETDKIAKQVSEIHNVSVQKLYERALNQNSIEAGIYIDNYCKSVLDNWLEE